MRSKEAGRRRVFLVVSIVAGLGMLMLPGSSAQIETGVLRWMFPLEWTSELKDLGSPARGPDGSIYFGAAIWEHEYTYYIFALSPTGNLRWKYPLGESSAGIGNIAIGTDGTIYCLSPDRPNILLRAFNSDGSLKCQLSLEGSLRYPSYSHLGYPSYLAPAIGGDGTVYVGSSEGRLFAVTPDCSLKWTFDGNDTTYSSPTIGMDGTIYFAAGDLYALNPDGTLRWRFDGCIEFSSPAIGSDGTIYIGSRERCSYPHVYALDPADGSVKWKFNTGSEVENIAIGADGTIYFVSYDPYYCHPPTSDLWCRSTEASYYLFAINPDGTDKWPIDWRHTDPLSYFRRVDGQVTDIWGDACYPVPSPTIARNGSIYFGCDPMGVSIDGTSGVFDLYAEAYACRKVTTHYLIASDGTVYFGCVDDAYETNHLIAVSTANGGPADSPWPMFRHDERHTGRAGGP